LDLGGIDFDFILWKQFDSIQTKAYHSKSFPRFRVWILHYYKYETGIGFANKVTKRRREGTFLFKLYRYSS